MSSIKDLFGRIYKNEIMPKRHYSITLELNTMQELFDTYVDVYKYGLISLSGGDEIVQLNNILMDTVIKNKYYMESFGISPELKEYSLDEVHKLYIELIGELRTIDPNIFIKRIVMDNRIVDIEPIYPINVIFFNKFIKILKNNDDYYNLVDVIFDDKYLYNYKKRLLMEDKLFILRMKIVY
jgi:hypothetical protein